MLNGDLGAVQGPIRSEIFGPQRFAQHGRSLAQTHRASRASRAGNFFPRIRSNMAMLRQAHHYIGVLATTGYDISPAAEWLLDNFHLVQAQAKEISEALPRSYFATLPMLQDEPLAGLPRIYGVAWALVAHTDGAFDAALLVDYLSAYEEVRPLNLSEMWALPTTLRVVLIENLRRLAERVATNKAAREAANLCFDHISRYSVDALDDLLGLLNLRGVGPVFLVQMALRLQDHRATRDSAEQVELQAWLQQSLPDLAARQTQQAADQAADNLSMSNAITSLRAIGDADWPDIIASTSALMRLMLSSTVFEAEDTLTRDHSLHAIERLARRSQHAEVRVAERLLSLMNGSDHDAGRVAAHWLSGSGRPALLRALALNPFGAQLRLWVTRQLALPLYLGAMSLVLGSLMWWLLRQTQTDALWVLWLFGCLALFPASEAVVAVVNRLISESAQPHHLPRLALVDGIAPEHRVMVVIPGMLTQATSGEALAHRLYLHYLANPEPQAQFALLTDWGDAPTEHTPADAGLLADALAQVAALNALHPEQSAALGAPRFILLHRERQFSPTEQCWIGSERKRGKLEALVAALASGDSSVFLDRGQASHIAEKLCYVLTLDADTELPPGRLRELVGVAAHPHNRPQLDATGRIVLSGYGILQPRVAAPLPSCQEVTAYHWLFAGQCGMDPYSAASSEVYQDLFAQGTFTGKGLLHVQTLHAVLGGRLPAGRVLSHDLLEGAIARCAAVTDIALIEEPPFHADVAASRVHRWIRGDWQLLPFLLHPRRFGLNAVNFWKMFDNLRRSLVAPASLGWLLLVFATAAIPPGLALLVVLAAFSAGPLMGSLAGFLPSRFDTARRHFYGAAWLDLARAGLAGGWLLAQLLQQSMQNLDAIARALYRMAVSRRHLLQWTTAAVAAAQARSELPAVVRQHWREPLLALLLWGALYLGATPMPWLAGAFCLVWGAAPLWTWWGSLPRAPDCDVPLAAADRRYLENIARDTWRLFERCVGPADHHLPPDNLQVLPYDMVAHRTSPTNIGMYLLSVACARTFGWIGTQEMLARLEATLATLHTLARHQGHFMNWYDTRTCEPLLPMYVSTVDSGNLSAHLLATAQACLALAATAEDPQVCQNAIAVARLRLRPWLTRRSALNAAQRDELKWLLADHRATVRSARLDMLAHGLAQPPGKAWSQTRLLALASALRALAWQADFSFLYSRSRHLFHIGYRVAEHQRDAGFYDLLASESRLTSLLAVARGDVPVRHWAALGRPFFVQGSAAGLRSWTGSMFEYLMPGLVLREPAGSVLHEACQAALRAQFAFTRRLGLPWGISESAYAASDDSLAYQYAPQGVPGLALRRTPPDELVIAPYATALAAQWLPHAAMLNFATLEKLGARGRYGFIEALDFTSARRTGEEAFVPVATYMAHHQGMSIVALTNLLHHGAAQRWGMANAHLQAVSSLLHERVPREISSLVCTPPGPVTQAQRRHLPGLLREVIPGSAALEPTHVLSNGRYSVQLRANGAGASSWDQTGITRIRDDVLRDERGSFIYLRHSDSAAPYSITQHPAPDPAAHYKCVFHSDRVCFDAVWPSLQAHTTVWVSPEDDIEFRQVELRNLSDQALDIELISAFEPALSTARADAAHPAFMNLFVSAQWLPSEHALLFERKPRQSSEEGLKVAHFLTDISVQPLRVRCAVDRQAWSGRNRSASAPMASFPDIPEATPPATDQLSTGLDPICALSVTLRIPAMRKARLSFATAASSHRDTLRAVIDKYRQTSNVQRASLMSATLMGIRLRALRISAENYAAQQSLTSALVLSHTQVQARAVRPASAATEVCDRRLLWRFDVSGDHPLLLVQVSSIQGLGLLRALTQALGLWLWGRVACDLVVVNAEPASYLMPLTRELMLLRDRHQADCAARTGNPQTRLHLLRADELTAPELNTLHSLARVVLHADGRGLAHHVQNWLDLHEVGLELRQGTSTTALGLSTSRVAPVPGGGRFVPGSGEFVFDVHARQRPPRPWINVLANASFGAQVSEAGGGYTWAVNSRLNQLTSWSNDPVSDPPSEWFLLQNSKTRELWSVAPSAGVQDDLTYHVTHGQGFTRISHRRGDLQVTATWCVAAAIAVKQVHLALVNLGSKALHLRLIGIAEWQMGASRLDRTTVRTAAGHDAGVLSLWSTQRDRSAGFGDGTAFLATADTEAAPDPDNDDWTCDRRECFDSRGRLVVPDYFGQTSGDGLDPCAAMSVHLVLAGGQSAERTFLMGFGATPQRAKDLLVSAIRLSATQRLQQVRQGWQQLLGATTVKTPDDRLDALVNHWLLYQAVSCRLWAKAGFYQAGGATGFRDQLQDAMALAWGAPQMLRAQIVLNASRQFMAGDVQHWWHDPRGVGVRTHFSDDLLWLAYACVHYLRATGDTSLLDESVAFLDGPAIAAGAEDAYFEPTVSAQQATVYEHAARAIDRSLRVGSHGLPLMGSGDWNDGMNQIGIEGRGESVWLAWFLCRLATDFAPIAHERGDKGRAQRWERAAAGWRAALTTQAWDGHWFTRAYFDNGQALGASVNPEARIDLIAQAWAVLSGVAPLAMQQQAMASVQAQLVDPQAGLICLLAPPLVHAVPSAGYIQAYPGGVRENGGQYAHAAIWALMAQAQLATAGVAANTASASAGDQVYRYFTYLSPAHRSAHPTRGPVYGLEPYVMAGDVCSQPPYVGRGGWSWYTGAAAWLHRAVIESMFGLTQEAKRLRFTPCLPGDWPQAELTLRRADRQMRFILMRANPAQALATHAASGAQLLLPGQWLAWTTLSPQSCMVIPLLP
ncbi:MAG: carbohydrate-binding protein [Rhodoferax sp.]|nr:carbohydrate-binding protein [Rhodoferax sp.]